MTTRRGLLASCLAGCLMLARRGSGLAQTSGPSGPIIELQDALLTIMRAGDATPFPRRFALLLPVVDRVFDLTGILRACVGPRWSSFSPGEQAQLLELFRRFTVASYVANFHSFGGERFEILPGERAVGDDRVVSTQIVAGTDSPVRIDYVMHPDPAGGWRIADVLLDGSISRVAVQRSDFRTLLGNGGAAGLIAGLRQKVADLSKGTLANP